MYSMKILLLNVANQLFKVNFKPSIQYYVEAIFFRKHGVGKVLQISPTTYLINILCSMCMVCFLKHKYYCQTAVRK